VENRKVLRKKVRLGRLLGKTDEPVLCNLLALSISGCFSLVMDESVVFRKVGKKDERLFQHAQLLSYCDEGRNGLVQVLLAVSRR
jgi:hypothetical protein